MELKVIGKRLITPELDGKITEGEYRADVIGITLPRMYGRLDLSLFSFRITAVSEEGILAEQVLESEASEENIRLVWTVTADFTAASGDITLILAGVDSENKTQLKFTSSPFRINPDDRNNFLPSPTVIEQAYNQVQLEVQKAVDAAKRAEEAAESGSGVKSGGDITVDDEGIVTVNSVKGKTVGCDVPEDAVFTDTVYTLPAAAESALGGVKSGGDISVAKDGKVTVNSVGGKTVGCNVPENAAFTDTVYTLPKASERVLGGVILDGTTITADENGIISAIGGTGGYVLPKATDTRLGGVKVDGKTITVDESGVISAVGGTGSGEENVIESIKVNGVEQSVNNKSVDITVPSQPTKVSELENDSGYLTDIPTEYVTETELNGKGYLTAVPDSYATKTYVGEQIANADHLTRSIVTALPSNDEASENVIYMLKVNGVTGDDKYKEYMKIDGTVQLVGDTSVDLSDYAKTSDIPSSLPANGGNAATVNNHTVKADVPQNAVFTDTVYTLPAATADTLGGVKVDGTTITADENGVISAVGGGSGIGFFSGTLLYEATSMDSNLPTGTLNDDVRNYDYLYINAIGFSRTGTSSSSDKHIMSSALLPSACVVSKEILIADGAYASGNRYSSFTIASDGKTIFQLGNTRYLSIRGIKL